ncbi:MAG: hypothetical protein R3B97_00770 [Dehalococcoidia bacterium]|nr:hypothetical protein [Dehalococcoidia bacterium]
MNRTGRRAVDSWARGGGRWRRVFAFVLAWLVGLTMMATVVVSLDDPTAGPPRSILQIVGGVLAMAGTLHLFESIGLVRPRQPWFPALARWVGEEESSELEVVLLGSAALIAIFATIAIVLIAM